MPSPFDLMNAFAQSGGQSRIGAALPSFMQYFFGDSGKPYHEAGKVYSDYFNQSKNALNNFGNVLEREKDPTAYLNNLMSGYQESPYAKYLQDQSRRQAMNAASASGLLGSTPLLQQIQTNAGNIASADQSNWLRNALGLNTEYLTGRGNLANNLSSLYNQGGEYMAGTRFGDITGRQNDQNSLWAAISKLLG